jgi:hypothetical protein
MPINEIIEVIKGQVYRFSECGKKMIRRSIQRMEVEEALNKGEIIEHYPEDKYSPSCLIYGKTKTGRDLHVRVSLPPTVVIITTYEPDPKEWINFRARR